jgi:hypothetical protein
MSNLSSKVYATLTHPNTMRILLANFFKDSKDQAVSLLQKSGIAISNSAPARQVQIAWLKAMKDSASFRAAAADKLTHYVTIVKAKITEPAKGASSNFVGSYGRYYNVLDDTSSMQDVYSSDTSANDTSGVTSSVLNSGVFSTDTGTSNTGTGTSTASTSQGASGTSSGGFWSTLGSIFTPKVIQQGISTGLQAYSTNLTASANASSEKNALAVEQSRLAQAQLAAQKPSAGLSSGWKVAIGVTIALVLITAVAVFAHRKK